MKSHRGRAAFPLFDRRSGAAPATILLATLRAERRDIDKVIHRLQRLQRVRARRLSKFGTLDRDASTGGVG